MILPGWVGVDANPNNVKQTKSVGAAGRGWAFFFVGEAATRKAKRLGAQPKRQRQALGPALLLGKMERRWFRVPSLCLSLAKHQRSPLGPKI
jgi:hypothetical protein